MRHAHRVVALVALVLSLAAPPAARADGTAENEKIRVTLVAPATVVRGSTYELIIDFENLTDRKLKVRSLVGMQTPFGKLYGPIPSPKRLEPSAGIEVAALMLCEADTPLGTYTVFVEVRTGDLTLTIPHTMTVVDE
jgi:hypothetical protein